MTYFNQLTITTKTAYETWYAASEVACHYTAAAWQWYTETFFSEASARRYEEIGRIVGVLACFAISLGMMARAYWNDRIQPWVDAQVIAAQEGEAPIPASAVEEAAPVTCVWHPFPRWIHPALRGAEMALEVLAMTADAVALAMRWATWQGVRVARMALQ